MKRDVDAGFTLVETLLAMALGAFLFIALTYTAAAGLRSLEGRRLHQEALALTGQALEEARGIDYATAGIDAAEAGVPTSLDPDGAGPLPAEVMVRTIGGLPHRSTYPLGSSSFNVKRWVTFVDDPGRGDTRDYKRVVVETSWTWRGQTTTQRSEELLAIGNTNRYGLSFSPALGKGGGVVGTKIGIKHLITNQGTFADRFDFSFDVAGVTAYSDSNGNGSFDSGTDLALVDTNSNSKPDTGNVLLQPLVSRTIFIVYTFPVGTPFGTAKPVKIIATSELDPSAVRTVSDTFYAGGVPRILDLYLHKPVSGTAVMNTVIPTSLTETAQSINKGSSFAWVYTAPASPASSYVADKATVQLRLSRPGTTCTGEAEEADYTVILKNTTTGTEWARVSDKAIFVNSCSVTVSLSLPTAGKTLAAGQKLELRVQLDSVTYPNPRTISVKHDSVTTGWTLRLVIMP